MHIFKIHKINEIIFNSSFTEERFGDKNQSRGQSIFLAYIF